MLLQDEPECLVWRDGGVWATELLRFGRDCARPSGLDHVGTSYSGLGQAPGCSCTAGPNLFTDVKSLLRPLGGCQESYTDFMYQELAGVAEVAQMLGVSRQRVHQIVQTNPEFPKPIAELSAGRIWRREEIEVWAQTHPDRQKSGPRRRSGPGLRSKPGESV